MVGIDKIIFYICKNKEKDYESNDSRYTTG